jgi:hypothetical protein
LYVAFCGGINPYTLTARLQPGFMMARVYDLSEDLKKNEIKEQGLQD